VLGALLPQRWALRLVRAKNVLLSAALYGLCRRFPRQAGQLLLRQVARALPPGRDVSPHFTPAYGPWTQRLCVLPDGDLLRCIAAGQAEMVTDRIAQFTADGLRLASGRELQADIVVSATGLQLQMAGGAELSVDGRLLDSGQLVSYKGVMYAGVPNLAATFGYTNASWTLKADLTSAYVCRLLRHLRRHGLQVATPDAQATGELRPITDFSSGYFERASALLPKQGSRAPFNLHTSVVRDVLRLRWGRIDDGTLRFRA
jgi:cation diffusion facilitator CzcD-associated flavoprotein CzcO